MDNERNIRPRRRSENYREAEAEMDQQPTEIVGKVNEEAEAEEDRQPTGIVEKVNETAEAETPGEPVTQAADSRVPPEARRMNASPYGAASAIAARRPGTRPAQPARRPPQEPRRVPDTRRPVRPAPQSAEEADGAERKRVSVGYAPGRMSNPHPRTAQDYIQDLRNAQEYGREPRGQQEYGRGAQEYGRGAYGRETYGREARGRETYGREVYGERDSYGRDPRDPRRIGVMPEARYATRTAPESEKPAKKSPAMWILTAVLLLIGAAIVLVMSLPKDNAIRTNAEGIAKSVTAPVENLLNPQKKEPARIDAFSVKGNEKVTAPADVIITVTTDSGTEDLRLVDEDGDQVDAELTRVENTDNNLFTLTMHVRDGYEGVVTLQTKRAGEKEWAGTEYTATLAIAPPLTATEVTLPPAAATATENPPAEKAEVPAAAAEDLPVVNPDETGDADGSEGAEGDGPAAENGEAPAEPAEDGETPAEPGEDGETPAEPGEEDPEGGAEYRAEAEGITPTVITEETETPEPTAAPTAVPPLTAEADPSADPSLITTTTVYDGSKKIKQYTRAAKALIHMPAGDEYTARKIGVLTFRGTAFRQNAAVGEVTNPTTLEQLWQVEAGSAKGAGVTYYGYDWTGQPAIAKWSTQVREGSNIDEEKRTKSALREVIIAGVDGVIRFLDLEDGTPTRSAINLGYPMKGTPSLHPAGYPYMNVGQFNRKMKNKTGSIGLRQYNLYTQKEQKLIDGLDGKLHRGINRVGSFETSALIDRTSDTVITLGTNGLLYLTMLNTEFDYKAGTLKISPASMVMSSRAKGQKKDDRVAVEASHAMYDRYVYYADVGGILRCVDTNYLAPVWAVDTGDAVYSAIALDQPDAETLDLYTANMLHLRKNGNAQIRKYNALSGKELWTAEFGVAKNTKTKEEAGVKASPVIGQNGLKDLVYYTVTGLSKDGCAELEMPEGTKAALAALDKATGKVRWAVPLSERSESSPVAVYDAEGNGWIIQCVQDGTILLLDGLTGKQVTSLQIDGEIKASPAVYNDIMVIGTTGKGTEFVYGIRIK